MNPLKHIRLSQQLTTLTEEIEELTSRKNQLMFEIGCHNESDITAAASNLKKMGEMLEQLKQQKTTLEAELSTETDRFYGAKAKVSPQQEDELLDARLPFREASTQRIRSKLQSVFGQKFDWQNLQKASQTVDRRLNEDSDVFRERILQKHWEQERQQRAQHRNQPKRKRGSWER